MTVRGTYDDQLYAHAVEVDDLVHPRSRDRAAALALEAEEERRGGVQVVDDDADVVEAPDCHGVECRRSRWERFGGFRPAGDARRIRLELLRREPLPWQDEDVAVFSLRTVPCEVDGKAFKTREHRGDLVGLVVRPPSQIVPAPC